MEKIFGGNFDTVKRTPYNQLPQSEQPEWKEYISDWIQKEAELEQQFKAEFEKPTADCEECHGTGLEETTYNPQSKWDWYSLGGRWIGFFPLKKGAKGETGRPGIMTEPAEQGLVDSAKVSDIDWEAMSAKKSTEAEESWTHFQKAIAEGNLFGWDESPNILKEAFIKSRLAWRTFSFITPDGKWHERADMGWWGMTSNEREDAYNQEWNEMEKSLQANQTLSVYDLHI